LAASIDLFKARLQNREQCRRLETRGQGAIFAALSYCAD
jgi:hypothetical protein